MHRRACDRGARAAATAGLVFAMCSRLAREPHVNNRTRRKEIREGTHHQRKPRVNGNTSLAVKELEAVFAEEDVETEAIQVGAKDIRGCIACGKCGELGHCVFDDIVNEFAEKFKEADGLIIASLVYHASANPTLIALLNRLFYSAHYDLSMKVGASVVRMSRWLLGHL